MEIMQNIGNEAVLSAILDAYPYQIVLCDRNHIIRYMNKNAAERYNGRIAVGDSIFGCHREDYLPQDRSLSRPRRRRRGRDV